MGYTHYFYRVKEFDAAKFESVVADFSKLLPTLKHLGVKLAGPNGKGKPIITNEEILFNGLEKCGHEKRQLGITWPAKGASGVGFKNTSGGGINDIAEKNWFAGAQLQTRTCGGDCSHETLALTRVFETKVYRGDGTFWEREAQQEISYYNQNGSPVYSDRAVVGKYFDCTKTAFKPYDLAVICSLIIAKHYLADQIIVKSDGELSQWRDGMELCQHFLGYGQQFKLDEEQQVLNEKDGGSK